MRRGLCFAKLLRLFGFGFAVRFCFCFIDVLSALESAVFCESC